MSENPEAFDFLRKSAYRFVQRHGKDRQQLYDYCENALTEWCRGNISVSDAEARQVVRAVTDWTIDRYKPPGRKADRQREERAATMMAAPVLLEYASDLYGAATVRNAARVSGQSKSTVAR